MVTYSVKGWSDFQNYKERRPPWIRLYRTLLDSQDYHELSPAAAKVLTMLWLLASEEEGRLPDVKKMAFRLRVGEKQLESLLSENCERGFLESHSVQQHASSMQAACPQHACLETETETETEERRDRSSVAAKPIPPRPTLPPPAQSEFQQFWAAYPKRKNKGDAEKAWKKLSPPLDAILDALAWQSKTEQWTREGGQFIPYPSTYLSAKAWMDEPEVPFNPEPQHESRIATPEEIEAMAEQFGWVMPNV